MPFPILVLNSGSSSIKFSIYETADSEPKKLLEGAADGIGNKGQGHFAIENQSGKKLVEQSPSLADIPSAWALIAKALTDSEVGLRPAAIGHRMVCGGPTVTENQLLTLSLMDEMEKYTAFAPLHTPAAIYIMREAIKLLPDVPNFVCLDSYFHRNLPEVTRHLPIPDEYRAMGLRRFGAHGLSYESIVAHLEPNVPPRLIVAHLGNGASISAIRDGKSIDTSMGLTPTGGLISGSRTGDLDPGVLLFLLRKLGETSSSTDDAADQLEKLVNKQSGLQGLSQLTNDMRSLREAISKGNSAAKLAADEFAYVLRKYIGAYIAVLGGLDMLVFTGGIGEHDSETRAAACIGLEFLGIQIDPIRNNSHGEATISADGSPVTVRVIPAAEDLTIVRHVLRLLN